MNVQAKCALACAGACVAVMALSVMAQDNVYFRKFKISPKQHGMIKTKFYYNSVEFPDILSSIVTLSFNEYTYVFNQTNDISDMFYWRRTHKINGIYKYDNWIDRGGRVKMLINTRRQWADVHLKGVNLLGLSTNKTGVHTVSVQISDMQKAEHVYFVNYSHAGRMPYDTNFFMVRALQMRYNKGLADMFYMRFICKYNYYLDLPEMVPATFVVDGVGGVSEFTGLTFFVPLMRQNKTTFTGQEGPVRATVNFKTGTGSLVFKKQALPIEIAPYQSNFVFTVRAIIGEPQVFDEQTSLRASHIHANRMSY